MNEHDRAMAYLGRQYDASRRIRLSVLAADSVLLARGERPVRARLAIWLLGRHVRWAIDAVYRSEADA